MKQPNKVRLIVLVPPEMKKAIEDLAIAKGDSEGEIVRYALSRFLEQRRDELTKR